MKALAVLLVVGLSLWSPVLADNLPIGLDAMWNTGDKAFQEKHYSDAVGWYDKCVAYADFLKQPKDRRAALYRKLGRALVEAGKFDKAMEVLNRALDLQDQVYTEEVARNPAGESSAKAAREMGNLEAYDALSAACAGEKRYQEAADWLVKKWNFNKLVFPQVTSDGLLESRIGGWYWKAGMKAPAEKWLSEARTLLQADLDSGKAMAPDTEREMLKNADSALAEIRSGR